MHIASDSRIIHTLVMCLLCKHVLMSLSVSVTTQPQGHPLIFLTQGGSNGLKMQYHLTGIMADKVAVAQRALVITIDSTATFTCLSFIYAVCVLGA